ncbi:hypothetical protein KC343_g1, partial [Hortaea werneckii]
PPSVPPSPAPRAASPPRSSPAPRSSWRGSGAYGCGFEVLEGVAAPCTVF